MDDYPAADSKVIIDILYNSGIIRGGIIYDKCGDEIAFLEDGEFDENNPYAVIKDAKEVHKTLGSISYGCIRDQHDNLVASIVSGMVSNQLERRPRTIFHLDSDGYVDHGTVRVKRFPQKRVLNGLQLDYETQSAIIQSEKKKAIPKEKSLLEKVMDRLYQRNHKTNDKM